MRVAMEVPAQPDLLMAALEGLVSVNGVILLRPALPPLYRSGVRYRRERGTENWKSCDQVFASGYGDCEDLCAWRVAELRQAGELGAYVTVIKTGPALWHVQVMRGDGRIEDPSRILGMGSTR
jgi:hypothetical protein